MHCKDTILRTQNNWPYSKFIPNSGIEYDQLTKDERDEIFTEKGVLLLKKINGFHERRYNGVGKHLNPDNRCFCKGSQAYYYNGDYYDIDVHPDGHIASFYKREK